MRNFIEKNNKQISLTFIAYQNVVLKKKTLTFARSDTIFQSLLFLSGFS
jgi:hypothetical protein